MSRNLFLENCQKLPSGHSNENERFPTLSEEELANLGSENQNQNTSKSTNLAERKCSVAKR